MPKGVILLVDNSPESLLTLTVMLTAAGYHVHPADSGELAVISIAASKPEVILLDIGMLSLDGLELCRRIKSERDSQGIPIILVTATTQIEERLAGLKAGAVDFVSRPFQKEELLARIDTHLELSRLRSQLEQQVAARTAELTEVNRQLHTALDERILATQVLREREAHFRSIADTAPAIIWTSGPDAKIDFCNKCALDFTGRSLEQLAGDRWKEIIHPEDLEGKYLARSEERRVGKECRSRWSPYH